MSQTWTKLPKMQHVSNPKMSVRILMFPKNEIITVDCHTAPAEGKGKQAAGTMETICNDTNI